MSYSLDVKFGIIKRSKPITINLKRYVIKAFNTNKKFFGKKLSKKFNIVICDSEKEFKKESKYYYFPFGSGTVLRDGTLVVKSPELTKMNNRIYQILLDHETNHVFFALIYGTTKPVWIQEGLANILTWKIFSKRKTLEIIKKKKITSNIIKYRYLYRDFSSGKQVNLMYSIWKYFIEYLTKNNPRILIKFMDAYIKKPTKYHYKKLFKRFFKKTEKEAYSEFVNSL